MPGSPRDFFVCLFELVVQPAGVKVALKLRDMPLLTVVTAHFVEHFDEHREQGVDLPLADDIGLLIDIEQDALRGNRDRALEIAAQDLVVATLWKKKIQGRRSADFAVFQQQREHLQQV